MKGQGYERKGGEGRLWWGIKEEIEVNVRGE